MYELLSNYWVGMLVLGPLAGVLWAWLLDKSNVQSRSESNIRQKSIIEGSNNNVTQQYNSNNRNEIKNFYNGNSNGNNDGVNHGLLMLVLVFFTGACLSWFFAKFGLVFSSIALFGSLFVGVFATSFISYYVIRNKYLVENLAKILFILIISAANIVSAWLLRQNINLDAMDYAKQESNVLDFFLGLSKFGKTLLLTQAGSGIILVFSMLLIIYRTYRLSQPSTNDIKEAIILIPIFAILPLWLSNPDWSVNTLLSFMS